MSSIEQRVLDAIDTEGMLAFLGRLIAVPSVGGAETAAQEMVAEQMERAGLAVDRWPIDLEALRRHPSHSEEIERQSALGVVGRLRGSRAEPSLILNGHVDVVPAGAPEAWKYPPWQATITDRRIYGRGAVDMKGGLCCALFAAKALRDAGIELAGTLIVQSVVGEEDGGTGTLAALLRGHTATAAIIMEPTRLQVVTTHAGALNFRLRIRGRAAHGALRNEGVSAIDSFLPLLAALRELERTRNQAVAHPTLAQHELPYPISIGTLSAGNWASTVPEELVCEGRYGVAVGESITAAQRAFEGALARASAREVWLRDNPPEIEWWGGRFEPAETPIDHEIVETVRGSVATLTGYSPQICGVPYGADMRLLVHVGGIPTILFGPGDVRQAHRADEFVPIDDLILTVRALALTALRYCGLERARVAP